MASEMPERLYSIAEVAKWLGVCEASVRRYIKLNMFENLVVIPHPERPRYKFTNATLDKFVKAHNLNLKVEDRPKRVYNRRVVKGKHKKKGKTAK